MKIKINAAMKAALVQSEISDAKVENPTVFQDVIDSGVSVERDCYTLSQNLVHCKGVGRNDLLKIKSSNG
jgi:hypothetical protein